MSSFVYLIPMLESVVVMSLPENSSKRLSALSVKTTNGAGVYRREKKNNHQFRTASQGASSINTRMSLGQLADLLDNAHSPLSCTVPSYANHRYGR